MLTPQKWVWSVIGMLLLSAITSTAGAYQNTLGIQLGNGDRTEVVGVGNTLHWCQDEKCAKGVPIDFKRGDNPCDQHSSDLSHGVCVIAGTDDSSQNTEGRRLQYHYPGGGNTFLRVQSNLGLGPHAFLLTAQNPNGHAEIDHLVSPGDVLHFTDNFDHPRKIVFARKVCIQDSGGTISDMCTVGAKANGDFSYDCDQWINPCGDPTLHVVSHEPNGTFTLKDILGELFGLLIFHGHNAFHTDEVPITWKEFFADVSRWL
jgi:hypothetical protein